MGSSGLYAHRGFMLDTGRKFFPVRAILDLLTVLHEHNFNVFHWHIYDAESFPLLWPADRELTNVSMRYSHASHYYTPEDIQTVIMYAQKLGILVYPETDMPGHSDIWGLWNKDLIVGQPDLKRPHAQLDIRPQTQPHLYSHITNLISTIDRYFQSPPLHHFGADEVAYIWHSNDDNQLFESFLHWLRTLCPNKSRIIWDDALTDAGKRISLDRDWIIQTWHDGVTQDVLDRGHRVIVSESDTFYIGNADAEKLSAFRFPDHSNVLGFEVVWFTSTGDDPWDFRRSYVLEPMRAASKIRRRRS
ncbi:putative beta-hexosaminidase [Aspergillus sergii]|uniref:beta-N-acetylhexosaminidase n=1 Tax=Aspergillus sergii TaxID=1034303 RepID=A0A5N6XIY4_9EURO|nr:putative beta-hexosaminidase [Aspergillus sergii]